MTSIEVNGVLLACIFFFLLAYACSKWRMDTDKQIDLSGFIGISVSFVEFLIGIAMFLFNYEMRNLNHDQTNGNFISFIGICIIGVSAFTLSYTRRYKKLQIEQAGDKDVSDKIQIKESD